MLELAPDIEQRIKRESARRGVAPDELLRSLLDQQLPELSLARQTALAAEATLAKIWDTPEEDEAWRHL